MIVYASMMIVFNYFTFWQKQRGLKQPPFFDLGPKRKEIYLIKQSGLTPELIVVMKTLLPVQQESIIDSIASFINCWIVDNCHNEASNTVKITKVFVDRLCDITTVNQSCISLFQLL